MYRRLRNANGKRNCCYIGTFTIDRSINEDTFVNLRRKAEALSGLMTPQGKRVQTINSPGSVAGPGAVITWGTATADRVDAMGFKWEWMEGLASTVHLSGAAILSTHFKTFLLYQALLR